MRALIIAILMLCAAAQTGTAGPPTLAEIVLDGSVVTMVQSKAKRSSAACQGCITGPFGEWCPVDCCREKCGTRKRSNFAQCACDCSAGMWDNASKTCF